MNRMIRRTIAPTLPTTMPAMAPAERPLAMRQSRDESESEPELPELPEPPDPPDPPAALVVVCLTVRVTVVGLCVDCEVVTVNEVSPVLQLSHLELAASPRSAP
jgi:hypothetical protein